MIDDLTRKRQEKEKAKVERELLSLQEMVTILRAALDGGPPPKPIPIILETLDGCRRDTGRDLRTLGSDRISTPIPPPAWSLTQEPIRNVGIRRRTYRFHHGERTEFGECAIFRETHDP